MSLSERIAALNKRANPSPPAHPPATISLSTSPSSSKFVKDKAAKFDGLGAAPAPRGSFGLGAPSSGGQKSNKELYGNRIPSVAKENKINQSGSLNSLRTGSPGPLQALRAEMSNPSSPALSRKSSFESDGSSLPGGRAQAAVPAEPLTEAAVDSLPSAIRVKPSGGASAYQIATPSALDHEQDASSSVAVEVDDADATSGDFDADAAGKTSPSFTNSTVSESALREAPPVFSPDPSTSSFAKRPPSNRGRHPSEQESVSSFATARSVSSVLEETTSPGAARYSSTSYNSSMDAPDVITPQSEAAKERTSEPSVAPLPLSSHLLQTLQVNGPVASQSGMETPRSVIVETGSEGSRAGDIAEGLGEVDLSEKALDASFNTATQLSENTGDVDDLEVRPDLRMLAPVLPLSSAHLRSLNVQSSLAPSASGYDTPRSMAVEDGSVDGRSVLEASGDYNMADHDYIQSEVPGETHTPPGLSVELPQDETSPRNQSPIRTTGTTFPSTPPRRPTGSDSAPRKSSLPTLNVPSGSSEVVDMRTPLATTADLPDEHRTPPAGGRNDTGSRERRSSSSEPVPAASFNGTTSTSFE